MEGKDLFGFTILGALAFDKPTILPVWFLMGVMEAQHSGNTGQKKVVCPLVENLGRIGERKDKAWVLPLAPSVT